MEGIIGAALTLATEVFKFINTVNARKYLDELVDLQQNIKDEENKGGDADDAKIESLYERLKIILQASEHEIRLLQSKDK